MLLSLEGDLKSEEVDRISTPADCAADPASLRSRESVNSKTSQSSRNQARKRNLADFCDIDPDLKTI